jgi:hypothetical protein
VLLRPVALGPLIDALERVLGPGSAPISRISSRPRAERTVQLPDTGVDPLRELDEVSDHGTPAPGESVAPASTSLRTVAAISERLRALLDAADRRAFPGRPPIDLSLPGMDVPAAELVPNEILDHGELSLDALVDEDPMESLASAPVLPAPAPVPDVAAPAAGADAEPDVAPVRKTSPGTPTSLSRRPGARETIPPQGSAGSPLERHDSARPHERGEVELEAEPPSEAELQHQQSEAAQKAGTTGVHEARVRPPSVLPSAPRAAPPEARADWPEEDSVLGRASPDGGRRGTLGDGGAMRLLLRVAELRLDARVAITPSPGDTVGMTFAAGELVQLDGPVASRAVDILSRRGARLSPGDETSSRRVLEQATEAGEISALERDRAMRQARERLLGELVGAKKASFTLSRLEPRDLPARTSPIGATIRAAIVEAARRSIDAPRAAAILGGANVVLRRGPAFDALAEAAVVAPEIAALLGRRDGGSLDRLLAEAPDEPGLLGLVCALVAADALRAAPAPAPEIPIGERARGARRLIEDAARAGEDGDYFAILGVAPDAGDRDVERAYETRRDQLASIAIDELGLEPLSLQALDEARRRAIEALDEAFRVLSEPRWRMAYASALAPPP